jgi:CBS domain-containing protein
VDRAFGSRIGLRRLARNQAEVIMRIGELLRHKAAARTVPSGTSLREAARLMMKYEIGGLPVLTSTGSLVGFLSERDVVKSLDRAGNDTADIPVDEVMRRPAPVFDADASLQQVMTSMTRERLRHVVIMEGGRIGGVISVGDLVKHRLEQLETETGVLRDYVAAQRARP